MFATRNRSGSVRPSAARCRARLSVNSLECRVLPAIYTVTNTLDSGPGSLRQAALDSNAATGFDEVVLLNERGEVAECTTANIFCVHHGHVLTPPLASRTIKHSVP